jgi:hypothetical protein
MICSCPVSFDFRNQFCVFNSGAHHAVWSCDASRAQDFDFNPSSCLSLGNDATNCGKIQLYECQSGYGFDSSGNCVPGVPGGADATLKKYHTSIPVAGPIEGVQPTPY